MEVAGVVEVICRVKWEISLNIIKPMQHLLLAPTGPTAGSLQPLTKPSVDSLPLCDPEAGDPTGESCSAAVATAATYDDLRPV